MNNNIEIIRKKARSFTASDVSKVYMLQNRLEIITRPTRTRPSTGIVNYRRHGRDECINIVTGEIKPFKRRENKGQNLQSLHKAYTQLARIINANFTTDDSEVHIVLTYAEQVYDPKILTSDLRRFKQRLQYYRCDLKYISMSEPHAAGHWHCHLLIKQMDGEYLELPIKKLREMWPYGRVYVGRLKPSANPGGYYAAKPYMYPERMQFYPSGMKLYQCSSGIIRPEPIEMARADIDGLISENGFRYKESWTFDAVLTFPGGYEYPVNSVTREIYERRPPLRKARQKKTRREGPELMGALDQRRNDYDH